jgi:predicted MPP superfamily phosphohydrolase
MEWELGLWRSKARRSRRLTGLAGGLGLPGVMFPGAFAFAFWVNYFLVELTEIYASKKKKKKKNLMYVPCCTLR